MQSAEHAPRSSLRSSRPQGWGFPSRSVSRLAFHERELSIWRASSRVWPCETHCKSRSARREPSTSSRSVSFPPISSAAPKWGGENAPSHLRQGTVTKSKLTASQWQARFGGACHERCETFQRSVGCRLRECLWEVWRGMLSFGRAFGGRVRRAERAALSERVRERMRGAPEM